MSDLFEGTEHQPALELKEATKVKVSPKRRRLPFRWNEIAIGAAAIAAVIWGAWVTKSVIDRPDQPEFVQLQLQSLISEYLRGQARSGKDQNQAAQETAQFMAVLDAGVAELGEAGKVVLVHEAVVGGDIPDVTARIKQQVYSQVPLPSVGASKGVNAQMQDFLSEQGAPVLGGENGGR
ncbi:MAG: TrbI F-type domain-containing protein [Pseudomonadota bacterium]